MPKRSQEFEGYICLSAKFWDDPEVEALGMTHAAFYLQMACRIRQLRTDGWITQAQVTKLGYQRWRAAVAAMVGLGMLTEHTNAAGAPSYYMPAYLEWNFSEAEYEEKRQQKSKAGRKSRCVKLHGEQCGCWNHQEPAGNRR